MDRVAIEAITMTKILALGKLARFGVLARLENLGVGTITREVIAYSAGLAVQSGGFTSMQLIEEAALHDPSKVFTPGHIARTYGANLAMLGTLDLFGAAAEQSAPALAKALGLVKGGGKELSQGGLALVTGLKHAAGLGGMMASTQINQGLGLSNAPKGGLTESLLNDTFSYFKYSFAQHFVEPIVVEHHERIRPEELEKLSLDLSSYMKDKGITLDLPNPITILFDGRGLDGNTPEGSAKGLGDASYWRAIGLSSGLATLLAEHSALASDGGPLGGMGPTEASVILSIALLIGGGTLIKKAVAKYRKGRTVETKELPTSKPGAKAGIEEKKEEEPAEVKDPGEKKDGSSK